MLLTLREDKPMDLMATLVLIAMLALVGGIVEESAKVKTR